MLYDNARHSWGKCNMIENVQIFNQKMLNLGPWPRFLHSKLRHFQIFHVIIFHIFVQMEEVKLIWKSWTTTQKWNEREMFLIRFYNKYYRNDLNVYSTPSPYDDHTRLLMPPASMSVWDNQASWTADRVLGNFPIFTFILAVCYISYQHIGNTRCKSCSWCPVRYSLQIFNYIQQTARANRPNHSLQQPLYTRGTLNLSGSCPIFTVGIKHIKKVTIFTWGAASKDFRLLTKMTFELQTEKKSIWFSHKIMWVCIITWVKFIQPFIDLSVWKFTHCYLLSLTMNKCRKCPVPSNVYHSLSISCVTITSYT